MPFPTSSSRTNDVLKLVHADVCGPMENVSIGRARYFLVIKDDYSSYRQVYFLKQKSEVKTCIRKFIVLSERETNKKVLVFRTDNELEFMSREINDLFKQLGIRHQRLVTYTLQQNGRAEREVRILVEAAGTMLQGLEKKFWTEAINTAAYVLNRTGLSSVKGKAPYELWCDKPVDNINKLKNLWIKSIIHVPKETRLKWDPKEAVSSAESDKWKEAMCLICVYWTMNVLLLISN